MSRLRIEALVTTILAACGGATESATGDGGTTNAKDGAWSRFAIDIDVEIARELGIPNGDTSRRMLEALASAA